MCEHKPIAETYICEHVIQTN